VAKKNSNADRARITGEALVYLALGKACYKLQDYLLDEIIPGAKKKSNRKIQVPKIDRQAIQKTLEAALGVTIATIEGRTFQVADKFADRNSIGVGLSARRFELEEVKTPS